MLTKHTGIFGVTGSGKTEYAMKLFYNMGGINIFVNTGAELKVEELGQVYTKMDDLIKGLNEDIKLLVYTPPEIDEGEFEKLQAVLFAIGNKFVTKEREVWAHIFFDEVHLIAGKMKSSVIENFWTRGYRYGIVAVAISQRPALCSQTILSQCYYHVIFELGDYEIPYFQAYRIPIEEHKDWLHKKYHYIIKTPTEVIRQTPIEKV